MHSLVTIMISLSDAGRHVFDSLLCENNDDENTKDELVKAQSILRHVNNINFSAPSQK